MPKRKLSQGQTGDPDPDSDPLGGLDEMEVDSEVSVHADNSHSAPKAVKPECTEIITTFEEDDVMQFQLTSDSGTQSQSQPHFSETENYAEIEIHETSPENDIKIREDVYVISEITPDKFLVSHASETGEDNTNDEDSETIIDTTEGLVDFVPIVSVTQSSEVISDSDVQLVDFALCCANCGIQFDEGECPKISELILTESEGIIEENQLEYGIVVSVADALSFIFELKLNEEEQGDRPLVDAGIGLCNKCGNILAQMYKLHRDFYESATTNSYLDLLFAKMFSRDNQNSKNQSTEKKSHEEQKYSPNSQTEPSNMEQITPAEKIVDHKYQMHEKSPLTSTASSQHLGNAQNNFSQENQTGSSTSVFRNSTDSTTSSSATATTVPIPTSTATQPQNLENSQPNSTNNGIQPNYLVICPLVIAASPGTNTLATMKPQEIKNQEDAFFNSIGAPPPKKKYRRNRPKFTSTCPECGKTFHSYLKNALEAHINIVHRNESPHTCTICGRPCSNQKTMEGHMRTHLGKDERGDAVPVKPPPKDYLCSECGTTLKSASSLRLHLSKHTNPKPYHCEKCNRRFGDKVTLRRHQVIHEEDGFFQYRCDGCEQAFKVPSLLKEHNMYCVAKSAERPHRCNLCGKRFKLKQHLELHLFEMHKFSKEGARDVVYPGVPRKKRAK